MPPPDGRPRLIETAYRSSLAEHGVLVAGSLPTGPAVIRPAAAGRKSTITLHIALTRITAATFDAKVGSVLNLGPAVPGAPGILLKVTGIVKPADPASAFWQHDPELTAPVLEGRGHASALVRRRIRRAR